MRASIYNAMPQEAIDDLIAFMELLNQNMGNGDKDKIEQVRKN